MLNRICFWIIFTSFISSIIEALVLEKSINTFIAILATVSIMIFAIITIEVANRGEKRLRF
jgi:hypothetical protein